MRFTAAGNDRLLGLTQPLTEPKWDWSRDFRTIMSRALDLVANDPLAAAMVAAKMQGTHGPTGLHRRSLATLDDNSTATADERTLRRQIEHGLDTTWTTTFDTAGLLTRKESEIALDWMATVLGEGFLIRVWRPDRKNARYATTWRLLRPERISNPDNRPNDDRLYHGMELDGNGEIIAVHVEEGHTGPFGYRTRQSWMRIPWVAKDGTPNVIHRVGWRMPGMIRGISMFAPLLLLLKQLAGTTEAHVVAKRAQACTPVIYYVEDPEAAAKAARSSAIIGANTQFNPMQVYYAKIGQEVVFPQMNYQGTDFDAFFKICSRILCATWQVPVEVVLAQMGEASLSSARAGLDQFDRTAQTWQNDHEMQASRPIDESYIREDVARGRIQEGETGLAGLLPCRYSRPPKYSTDRLKDANTVQAQIDAGRSKTAAFADMGWSFEDETEERIRDEEFERQAREEAGLLPDVALDETQTEAASASTIINMPQAVTGRSYRINRDKAGQATGIEIT